MKDIQIPKMGENVNFKISVEKNVIIIGANGAGKSRFGSKIEQLNNSSKRISAQRYLQLTEVVQRQDFETADQQLKNTYKNQPSIIPQNDYQQVLISLFAQESKRDSDYVASSRMADQKVEISQSVKEKVIDLWNFIFPYRQLKLESDRVRAIDEADAFSGTEMSDGEKVGLYLISQILLAEKNCTLIIDEPELHLHKSLMIRLWNKLEEYRDDCTFIYITHDLDFAVSKPASKLIWMQGYKKNTWTWKELDPNEIIPENLFLEMLGSRKPILFVEGEKGSLDIQIYQTYYDGFTVIPRGGCEKVIESVRGLKNNTNLHDKEVYGLIDTDARSDEQLTSLKSKGVFSVSLSEIENIFLVPEIIEIVCDHLSKNDKKDEIISEIREIYEKDKENVSFSILKYRMYRTLNEKFGSVKNKNEYENFKTSIISELDQQFVSISLPDKSVELIEILKIYPHKGLVKRIQNKVELTGNEYKNLVLNFLSSEKRKKIIDVLKSYLPEIK